MKTLQPNSQHCFVCGVSNPFGLHLRFYNIHEGEVEVECIIPSQYQGYPGIVHGGVVAAMLDEAAGRSQMDGDPPRFMYTARLNVHYRKNVPVGQPLRLVGKALARKGRSATAYSAIYNQEGALLAEAEAVLVNVPDHLVQGIDLESIGWKIYSDEEIDP